MAKRVRVQFPFRHCQHDLWPDSAHGQRRPIIPGDKRAHNKLAVGALANQVYDRDFAGGASRPPGDQSPGLETAPAKAGWNTQFLTEVLFRGRCSRARHFERGMLQVTRARHGQLLPQLCAYEAIAVMRTIFRAIEVNTADSLRPQVWVSSQPPWFSSRNP